jgi:HK97 family phage major capsid protein
MKLQHQITANSELGQTDNFRTERLLAIADVLTRDQGGASLRWPSQSDILTASARRDFTNAPTPSTGPLSLGQQLRPHSAIARLGASFVTLPVIQDSGLPTVDRSKKAAWGTAVDVDADLVLTTTTPRRLSAFVLVSKRLIRSSPVLASSFVEGQLLAAVAGALDAAAVTGTGADGEPFGLLADGALLEYEMAGASLAVADLLGMEKAVADAHGDNGDLAWLASTDVRQALRDVPRMTGSTVPLWPDSKNIGPLGYAAAASPWAPASSLILGNFTDLLVLQSGTVDILTNPYSLDTEGFIRMTVSGYFDVVALSPESSFVRAVAAE